MAIMTPGGAMVGALAAVLTDAPAELRELQHQRVVQQTLVPQVGVEREQAVAERAHQIRVRARAGVALAGVRVEAAGLHPVDPRADAADDRAGDRAKRQREPVVRIGQRWHVGVDRRDAVERVRARRAPSRSRTRAAGDSGAHTTPCASPRCARSSASAAPFGLDRLYVAASGMAGTRYGARHERARRLTRRVPARERIDRRRQRVEVPSEPADARGELGSRRPPDVRALEMRPARIRVPRALDDREPPLVEDLSQAGQPRMKAERPADWLSLPICST